MGVSRHTELELEPEPATEEQDLKCRLLSLPPEIRDMIYCQLLAPTGTIEIWPSRLRRRQLASKTCCNRGSSAPTRKQAAIRSPRVPEEPKQLIFIKWEAYYIRLYLAILRTCKQIHDEALARFYGDNTFKYENSQSIYNHLAAIGPRHRALIRNIHFHHHPRTDQTRWVGFLPQCTALKNLNIFMDDRSGDYCKRTKRRVLRRYGLVARLKHVRGLKLLNVEFQEEKILAPHLTQDRKIERQPLTTYFDAANLSEISGEVQELMRSPQNTPRYFGGPGVRMSERLAKRMSERLAKRRQMEE